MASEQTPPFDFDDLKEEVVNRLIYQPIGLLAAVLKTLPNAAEEGRRVVEGPLQTAKFVGDMAAGVVKAKYGARISDLEDRVSDVRRTVEGAADMVVKTAKSRVGGFGDVWSRDDGDQQATARRQETHTPEPDVTDSQGHSQTTVLKATGSEIVGGIVGYEAMTAADVIRHLDGLSLTQLGEVEAFELEHRRRRTVLGRISKLREERS